MSWFRRRVSSLEALPPELLIRVQVAFYTFAGVRIVPGRSRPRLDISDADHIDLASWMSTALPLGPEGIFKSTSQQTPRDQRRLREVTHRFCDEANGEYTSLLFLSSPMADAFMRSTAYAAVPEFAKMLGRAVRQEFSELPKAVRSSSPCSERKLLECIGSALTLVALEEGEQVAGAFGLAAACGASLYLTFLQESSVIRYG